MTMDIYWLSTALVLLDIAIVATLIPRIILQQRESGATLAWILLILFVPYLGVVAFWLLGATRLSIRRRKRRKAEARLASTLAALLDTQWKQAGGFPAHRELIRLAKKLDDIGPRPGNRVMLLQDGPAAFQELENIISGARHSIHLLYYIWEPDQTGKRLRDALATAVRRGVEVRLLVDDVGSRHARSDFFSPLIKAGGRVARFLPINLLSRHIALNNRNHRKIVVVDGVVAFTGGMNVGDSYAGLAGPWFDLHVKVEGPAVLSLQEIFCQDWYHATGEDLALPGYFPPQSFAGKTWVQFLASGPADGRWRSIHVLLFAAINLARERVWIQTPYFVPDAAIVMALQTSALRGVDVRLMLPCKSDHPLVLYAGRSFYSELLASGVRIWEFPRTMLHVKMVTVDGLFSTVGSTNMDQRSFRLNFEANAFFYDQEVARTLEAAFRIVEADAKQITQHSRASRPYRVRLVEGLARTLAPLL